MLSNLLKLLAPIKTGAEILDVVTSERMNAIQDCIRALCRGENVRTSANVRKKDGPDWYMLSANTARTSGGAASCLLGVSAYSPRQGAPQGLWVSWGTINGRQPKDMTARGLAIAQVPISGFVYAHIVFDFKTGKYQKIDIVVAKDEKESTPTEGYLLLASFQTSATGGLEISGQCGNVIIDPCTLPFQ